MRSGRAAWRALARLGAAGGGAAGGPTTSSSSSSSTSAAAAARRPPFLASWWRSSAATPSTSPPSPSQPAGAATASAAAPSPPPPPPSASVAPTPPTLIRNFAIIAHIDHGKSTLADRLLAVTGTVAAKDMRAQFLDSMDLERERGITIKLNQARMAYTSPADGQTYCLNLIDTPGHVDFSYEVSRSLAACEGALLVVDAAQGVEAQTLANVYLALENDLEIIPVLNKIDLPGAEPDRVAADIEALIGLDCGGGRAVRASAKTGEGVGDILEAIVARIPPPPAAADSAAASPHLRALIFDSVYDAYRGVIVYFRVMDGTVAKGDAVRLMASGKKFEVAEVGVLSPHPTPLARPLGPGEVGYLTASIKGVADARVGDTITAAAAPPDLAPLPGYCEAKAMVYCGLFPTDAAQFPDLREALGRLQLNDAALAYEPEVSPAMGAGFRCGFLGLLHMEIVQERLEREHGLSLITTAPTCVYRVIERAEKAGAGPAALTSRPVSNPASLPDVREGIEEPYARVEIITPAAYVGSLMELAQARRGEHVDMRFLSSSSASAPSSSASASSASASASAPSSAAAAAAADTGRAVLTYDIPLAEVVTDFFDELKARSKGYASMDYAISGYRRSDLVRLDVRINGVVAEPLACVVHRDAAYRVGKGLVQRLKALIPRHQFRVPLQAAVGSRVIASEAIPAVRKDVLAKCYGGDVSRKKKLLAKQAKGKKRMKAIGRVDVPQAAFMAVLSVGNGGSGGGGGGD